MHAGELPLNVRNFLQLRDKANDHYHALLRVRGQYLMERAMENVHDGKAGAQDVDKTGSYGTQADDDSNGREEVEAKAKANADEDGIKNAVEAVELREYFLHKEAENGSPWRCHLCQTSSEAKTMRCDSCRAYRMPAVELDLLNAKLAMHRSRLVMSQNEKEMLAALTNY